MRNEWHDDQENAYPTAGPFRRHRRALVGVAGLAVLGTGAFLVTSEVSDQSRAKGLGTTAIAPVTDVDPLAPPASPAASPPLGSPAASPGTTAKPKTRQEQIDAVRGTARKNASDLIQHPLRPPVGVAVADEDLTVTSTGSLQTDKATMRVVSAKQDLTGQRELRWVTDGGEAVGDAHCTNRIRIAEGAPAVEKPTLLLCWRTSASKSVYTVAVNVVAAPSKADSVAAIDKEWARLG